MTFLEKHASLGLSVILGGVLVLYLVLSCNDWLIHGNDVCSQFNAFTATCIIIVNLLGIILLGDPRRIWRGSMRIKKRHSWWYYFKICMFLLWGAYSGMYVAHAYHWLSLPRMSQLDSDLLILSSILWPCFTAVSYMLLCSDDEY